MAGTWPRCAAATSPAARFPPPLRAIRALWIQILTAAVSLALVIALITLIIDGSSNAFLKALFGVLGVAEEMRKRTLTTVADAAVP